MLCWQKGELLTMDRTIIATGTTHAKVSLDFPLTTRQGKDCPFHTSTVSPAKPAGGAASSVRIVYPYFSSMTPGLHLYTCEVNHLGFWMDKDQLCR